MLTIGTHRTRSGNYAHVLAFDENTQLFYGYIANPPDNTYEYSQRWNSDGLAIGLTGQPYGEYDSDNVMLTHQYQESFDRLPRYMGIRLKLIHTGGQTHNYPETAKKIIETLVPQSTSEERAYWYNVCLPNWSL